MGYALSLSDAELSRYLFMAERARSEEQEHWWAAGVVPGAQVADIGCGPGAVLAVLAELVGPQGSVDGVDADPAAVAAAEQLLSRQGARHAGVRQGSATASGLPAASYDVVMLRHVLAHNGGEEAAIVRHLAELVRPGGAVYVVDVDLTGIRLHPRIPEALEMQEAYARFHAQRGNDPSIGLRLGELLRQAGLEQVQHRGWFSLASPPPGVRPPVWAAREALVAEGFATAEDLARWAAAFERQDLAAERPTLFAPLFSAVGRRPGCRPG